MKYILITICTASMLLACNNDAKDTTDKKSDTTKMAPVTTDMKSEEWVPVDSATSMNAMMAAGTPGKEQAMLAKSNGTWKAETTMWMSPDAPPMKSTGVVTNKMVMGGRYQEMSFKGNMMGQPFEGMGTTGYDNAKKVFINTWVDNMSTGIMTMEGTWDDASKTVSYSGKTICPANGKWIDMKQTIKMVDDKTQLMEMWGPDMKTGKPYKSMEIKMTKS